MIKNNNYKKCYFCNELDSYIFCHPTKFPCIARHKRSFIIRHDHLLMEFLIRLMPYTGAARENLSLAD